MSETSVPEDRRATSIAEVGRLAGVSAQTVSRVVNGSGAVAAETRARVLAVVQASGYRPNHAARSLKRGRFHTIGVVLFTLSTLGNTRTLDGIVSAAAARGYSVSLANVLHQTSAGVATALEQLSELAVDGIVMVLEEHLHLLPATDIVFPAGIPIVVIDSPARRDHVVVDTDQAAGTVAAVEHLLALGHETVHHIAGPASSNSGASRRRTWEEVLRAAGRRVPAAAPGDWSSASGYRAVADWVHDGTVTAVFAANDQMALGAMHAFHRAGVAVPHDVSVVGFDDMPESADFWPPLTTVRQSFDRVGAKAVERLLAEIDGTDDGPRIELSPTSLVVRGSTAPARRGPLVRPV